MKSIEDINQKISRGEAAVLTAAELKRRIAEGEHLTVSDVDVVTTATFGIMSGTLALLHIHVSEPGTFHHAEKAWLNGVPAIPGPCPNERIGVVDLVVFGTSRANPSYGGGHLFRDLVEGKKVELVIEAAGIEISRKVTLSELGLARMVTTRSAFMNYQAFINRSQSTVKTIFSVQGISGPYREVTVSGCGDINPLQNDPQGRVIGVGSRVLLNGGMGYIMGQGTRSSREHPNLAAFADMKEMVPDMMGGFVTADGPECITSLGVAIPVIDNTILDSIRISNAGIPLPIADIEDRTAFTSSHYGEVWDHTDLVITYSPEACLQCEPCQAAAICPTRAIIPGEKIDPLRCVHCGTCIRECIGDAFYGDLGTITVDGNPVPITCRQSSREHALRICDHLKALVTEGKFHLMGKCGNLW
ncbi:MAG TPA: methanogenesis marker 16 metalloprotein [Methanoregulaceae archaeon]|nr:methanogenesis marker 16 metalloprotein [Methanoregulaceae archaeon]HNO08481.1 methanogenesis marker 16 metalloprotein [Methanoregulaceae archaeon]